MLRDIDLSTYLREAEFEAQIQLARTSSETHVVLVEAFKTTMDISREIWLDSREQEAEEKNVEFYNAALGFQHRVIAGIAKQLFGGGEGNGVLYAPRDC